MNLRAWKIVSPLVSFLIFSGCQSVALDKNAKTEEVEASWIRDGQPIEFEGELWYPLDSVDNLLDTEVLSIGRYQNVEFFVDKVDVRPYYRLYTKFGHNRYRAFEKKNKDDQGQRSP